MVREKPDEKEKRTKEYNARGERIYKNAINRENAKIKKEGHSEFHQRTQRVPPKDTGLKVNFSPRGIIIILYYIILYYIILLLLLPREKIYLCVRVPLCVLFVKNL